MIMILEAQDDIILFGLIKEVSETVHGRKASYSPHMMVRKERYSFLPEPSPSMYAVSGTVCLKRTTQITQTSKVKCGSIYVGKLI